MYLRKATGKFILCIGVGVGSLVACNSSSPSPATPTPSLNPKLGVVQKLLPPGFRVSGEALTVPGPENLAVGPDPGFSLNQVEKAPLPSPSQLALIAGTVINLSVGTTFRGLYLSKIDLQPGEQITVAAAGLGTTPNHDVLFVLQGPGYRAEHLVATQYGVAVGIVKIPNQLTSGGWVLAVVDYSQVSAAGAKLGGQVLADVAQFTIK